MKALIVDDDRILADVVAFTLRREGFQIALAYDGKSALHRWADGDLDIIILDVNLPKEDGFAVCQKIRAQDDIPIILLTVRGEEDDIVHGLEFGADDYIVKPFSPRQLVARTHAVLRRAGQAKPVSIIESAGLTFDTHIRSLTFEDGQRIMLTPLEARLLECLMTNAGQVMTTETIIDWVWGAGGADSDMLRQLVRRLRGKIEPDSSNPIYIKTVPGLGYGFMNP